MFRRNARITTTTVEAPVSDSPSDLEKLGSASREALTSLAAAVGPALADAREKFGPVIEDAREKIGPAVEDARVKMAPVMSDARDKMAPLAESAIVASKMQGHKAAVKLGLVEEPQPESHKIRNLIIVLGLGGAAAFAYKTLTGKDADPAWTASRDSAAASHANYGYESSDSSSDESHSSPESGSLDSTSHLAAAGVPPLSTDAPGDESDTAPSAPFASEETVESHVPTTPDEPLERKSL